MLSAQEKYMLKLLQKSMGIQTGPLSEPEKQDYIKRCVACNGILLTVYSNLPSELQASLKMQYISELKQSVLQNYEGERILKALSGAGFDCIPLKGWELQKLYPEENMRQMVDLDILVQPYKFESIKTVMKKLGYSTGTESFWMHDNFHMNSVKVEMHKRLTDDTDRIQKWQQKMWARSLPTEKTHIRKMSVEDFYIYHFIHLHHDFMKGSLGLRRILDTWLLQSQPLNMNMVKAELQKFGIWKFHEQMVKTARVAMGEEEIDERSEYLLRYAFKYGINGTVKTYKTSRIAIMGNNRRIGKIMAFFDAVFLPYSRMKAQFPILKRWPVLLPLCWTRRIIRYSRFKFTWSKDRLNYKDVSESDYREMRRFFEAGGVL